MTAAPAYRTGASVVLTVPIPVDGAGVPLTATSITRVVTDQDGNVISPATDATIAVPPAGTANLTVTIAPAFNTINPAAIVDDYGNGDPGGSVIFTTPVQSATTYVVSRVLRQVEVTFETPLGEFVVTQDYVVQIDSPLICMTNSFITLPQTTLIRYEMPEMNGWDGATSDQRIAALQTAYRHLLALRYRFPIGENFQSRIVDFYGMSVDNVFGRIYITIADIAFYRIEDFKGWPRIFQQALMRAQMAEADYLLGGDPVADKRDMGILMEATGESKMTFRPIPEVTMPISKPALRELRGFLNNATLIARG